MGEVELALADASEAAQTAVDAALAAEDLPGRICRPRRPACRPSTVSSMRSWSWTRTSSFAIIALTLLNRFEAVFSGIANIGELARKK